MVRNLINVLSFRRRNRGVTMPLSVNLNLEKKLELRLGKGVVFGAYGELLLLNASHLSSVAAFLHIGSNVYIGSFFNVRAVGGGVTIGANVQIAQHVSIIAANHLLGPGGIQTGLDMSRIGVVIGDGVWIGANAVILPGVTIGARAVVGAGAVVTRSIPEGEIWAGNPARFVRRP